MGWASVVNKAGSRDLPAETRGAEKMHLVRTASTYGNGLDDHSDDDSEMPRVTDNQGLFAAHDEVVAPRSYFSL